MEMTYTGDVTPGGAVDVRVLPHLEIQKLAVDEEMANNCYLLTCRSTGAQVLIDAADNSAALLDLCDSKLDAVITTHQHWDHHRALAAVVAATGAPVSAGEPDADAITEQTGVEITTRLQHGDVVPVGDCSLEVIAIAGHTPGSVALLHTDPDGQPHLFTGDSLFPGGVGSTFGDADAFATLIEEVERKVFDRLPDTTWFYPGHGKDGQLGNERPHLAEWRERGF